MKRITLVSLISFFCLSVGISLFGQVKLPSIIGDSMVNQREAEVKIWGWQ